MRNNTNGTFQNATSVILWCLNYMRQLGLKKLPKDGVRRWLVTNPIGRNYEPRRPAKEKNHSGDLSENFQLPCTKTPPHKIISQFCLSKYLVFITGSTGSIGWLVVAATLKRAIACDKVYTNLSKSLLLERNIRVSTLYRNGCGFRP